MGLPRLTGVAVWVALTAITTEGIAATYEEELSQCTDSYLTANGGSFSCSICGVPGGCSGNDCHWGALNANAANGAALGSMLGAGYQLYCLNHGGTMVASASPVAAQGATLDRAFREGHRSGSALSYGGVAEWSARTGGGSSYGAAVPFSLHRDLGGRDTDLDLTGTALVGHSDLLTQFGATARPTLRYFPEAAEGTQKVLGLSVPVQLAMTTGSAIESSLVYHAGIGGIIGVAAKQGLGVGAAADVLYASGLQVPVQVVARYATEWHGAELVVQPGVSLDPLAGGDVLSTLQQNVLAGWDTGNWIIGLRVFRQGSDAWVFALGATASTRAAKLAAGTDEAYRRDEHGARPADVKGTSVVFASMDGDAAKADGIASAAAEALGAHGLPQAERALATAATPIAGTAADARALDQGRRAAHALLGVAIVATTQATGSVEVVLTVTGRGIVAKRTLVVEPASVATEVRRALDALLSSLDVRGLPEAEPASAPDAQAPMSLEPAAPKPSPGPLTEPLAPSVVPPDAPTAPPKPAEAGCKNDLDCKGDRICEDGRCVPPNGH